MPPFATRLARMLCAAALLAAAGQPAEAELVGRLSQVHGAVTLAPATGAAVAAALNHPLADGFRLVTGPEARAEARVGSAALWLGVDSEIRVVEFGVGGVVLELARGELLLAAPSGAGHRVEFPGGTAWLKPGRYHFHAGTGSVAVTVRDGTASIAAAGTVLAAEAGKTVRFGGAETGLISQAAGAFGALETWAGGGTAGFAPAEAGAGYAGDITGMEALAGYGRWGADALHGPLWYPQVPTAWAPYRDGRWDWLAPWGWTWIDAAPWGFAPSHYGRWMFLGGAWAWAPGAGRSRPQFSPGIASLPTGGAYPMGGYPYVPKESLGEAFGESADFCFGHPVACSRIETGPYAPLQGPVRIDASGDGAAVIRVSPTPVIVIDDPRAPRPKAPPHVRDR